MAEPEGTGTVGLARYIPKQGTGIVGRLCTLGMVLLIAMGFGVYSIDGSTIDRAALKLGGVIVIAVNRFDIRVQASKLHREKSTLTVPAECFGSYPSPSTRAV